MLYIFGKTLRSLSFIEFFVLLIYNDSKNFRLYKRGAIYKIPCKDCSNVYVGETGRCFNTRLSEHECDLKPINLAKLKEDDLNKKTALVKHCFNYEHRIDFGNFEILNYNIDYDKRKFLESLYINNTKNSINDKDRNVFPKIHSNIKNFN